MVSKQSLNSGWLSSSYVKRPDPGLGPWITFRMTDPSTKDNEPIDLKVLFESQAVFDRSYHYRDLGMKWIGKYYGHICGKIKSFYDRSDCISKGLKEDSIQKITDALIEKCKNSYYIPIKLFVGEADLQGLKVWCFLNQQEPENIIILFNAQTGFLISFWHISRDQKIQIKNYRELHVDNL